MSKDPPAAPAAPHDPLVASLHRALSIQLLHAGFKHAHPDALDAYAAAFHAHLRVVAETAHIYAESAGRASIGLGDVCNVLNTHSLYRVPDGIISRGVVAELLAELDDASRIEFDMGINLAPSLSHDSSASIESAFAIQTAMPPLAYLSDPSRAAIADPLVNTVLPASIPSHLPPLPSLHAYQNTPTFVTRYTNPDMVREKRALERLKTGRAVQEMDLRLRRAESMVRKRQAAGQDVDADPDADKVIIANWDTWWCRERKKQKAAALSNPITRMNSIVQAR